MRFKNLQYAHTDVFDSDEHVTKFIADFDVEAIRKSGLEVDDDDSLVIELDVQYGEIKSPFITNLEDNNDLYLTDKEADHVVRYYKNMLLNKKI